MAGRMKKEVREVKIDEAIALFSRGKNFQQIAAAIKVSPHTSSKLVKDGLAIRAEHRAVSEAREEALAVYDEIITEGWTRLETLDNRSLNVSGVLNSIRQAQQAKDDLTGAKAPVKFKDETEEPYDIVFDDDEVSVEATG